MQDDMKDFTPTSILLIQRLYELAEATGVDDLASRYTISVMDGKVFSMHLPVMPDRFQEIAAAMGPHEVTTFAGCPAVTVEWFGVRVDVWEFHPSTSLDLLAKVSA